MRKIYKGALTLLLTLSLLAGVAWVVPTFAKAASPDEMEVHFIDVGEGDATLIKCGGQSMLIDAGDDSKGTAIQNYLQKQGVKNLDYLILTHPDADHIGGAPVIITKFNIDKVFVSNYEKDTKTYQKLIQALDNKRLKYITPKVGDKYYLGTASITIAGPNKEYTDPNDASIALTIQNGKNKFLFTGDAEEKAEQDILENSIDISADVYKVGHHGSKTSSSEAFLKAAAPSYAVISCGEGNSYGHPHAQTMNNLRAMGVQVYRTDEQGSIIATSDGNKISWNCSPSDTWLAGEPTGTQSKASAGSQVKESAGTGKAAKPEETAGTVDTSKITESTGAVDTPSSISYICNTNTGKFHIPSCASVSQMSEKNKLAVTLSRDEVIAQGYVPCKKCNP
ncbi:ComEC/Rec2 family competence protein [Parablautia muri]|uniref:MBL fold metallo-hydrolase n=1 Tax=Parablautia muri TaxID=2320879 RepID=A0A9X5BK21_9FIRM|nr:ComEC/Rec2 family competence protein [Parablautia muri]NBJ95158.1 MBL fold metallo-hydrolase [Parablautia muri]